MFLKPHLDDLLELRHQANALGLASHHQVNSVLCGLYASVFRGQGMDFEEVREYREGDEIRNMDWRVTARTGISHLKVFREERQRSVMLCVDIGPHMQFGTRGTFKSIQAARAAALLGWAAVTNHDRVGGLLFGDPDGLRYFRPSRERRGMWRVLRSLTEVSEGGRIEGNPLPEALDKLAHGTPTGALLLIIADLNRESAPLEQKLVALRQRHDIVLFSVDDPADREMPAMGRVVFAARDGARLELDTDNLIGQRQYRENQETRRAHLQVMCKRLGIDLIPVMTNEDVHRALVTGLRRRMRYMAAR
ncbi:MAG: DUF58 domain-containing protein [Gammaproteobacteria bacterium]|nr:DUF58 domain-containing protein [Gammaproteobacteria bacterium]